MEEGIAAIASLDALLVLSLKAALLLALSLIASRLLRKGSASTRYFLLSSTIIVVASSPLLFGLIPESKLPVPTVIQSSLLTKPTLEINAFEPAVTTFQGIPAASEVEHEKRTTSGTGRFKGIFIHLWLLGTCMATGRVLLGFAGCARYGRISRRVTSASVVDIIGTAARTLGLRRSPEVIVSRAMSPFVCGVFRPVIVLPSEAMKWSKGRLRHVVLHELAHIKRYDHITWPLINLVASWLWFLPFLWMALAQLRREKERACDDYIISCESGVDYARHLLLAYADMRNAAWPVSVSFLGTRGSEIRERITYMLTNGISRKPISRIRKTVLIGLLLGLTVPLLSITGLSGPLPVADVTLDEREASMATLQGFYEELSNGSDYQAIKERYLSSGYFDDPSLTLENLDEAVRRPPFDNTLDLIRTAGVGVAREVHCRIISMSRDRDELVVTQHVDVLADKGDGVVETYEGEVSVARKASPAQNSESTVTDCFIVKDLEQQIRLRKENGAWRIAKFDDGLTLMRMDTDNPYGPIFLVWIEDIDNETTPFGPGVFKVFPRDLIPDARNTKFILEE